MTSLTDRAKELACEAEAAKTQCRKCRGKGSISVRHGTVYITDDDAERELAWHDERCPDCGPSIEIAMLQFGAEVAEAQVTDISSRGYSGTLRDYAYDLREAAGSRPRK